MKKYLLLAMILPLAACQPDSNTISGYVEGEFVSIAPTTGGVLQTLSVQRGDKVEAQSALFSLDLTDLTAQYDSAKANVAKAEAELNDLIKGDRPEELEVITKQREQAQAALTNAQKDYDRILPLSKTGGVSLSKRDEAKATLDSAQARMDEIEAQYKTATLGARSDKIEAAKAEVDMAQQALIQIEKKLAEAAPTAPSSAVVEDTYFRPGEYVAAGQPVVNLLPPENVKIRFFVPQSVMPKLQQGSAITISCDGCGGDFAAHISYIAPESEFTPPVIYSVESRDKLVFLIEAKPDEFHSQLRPGLPVDVNLGL